MTAQDRARKRKIRSFDSHCGQEVSSSLKKGGRNATAEVLGSGLCSRECIFQERKNGRRGVKENRRRRLRGKQRAGDAKEHKAGGARQHTASFSAIIAASSRLPLPTLPGSCLFWALKSAGPLAVIVNAGDSLRGDTALLCMI